MTVNVLATLEIIKNSELFKDELYFVGGTALAYYLNHRISEDIDIVSAKTLNYKKIIPLMRQFEAIKIQDENAVALRMAGLFPDEYIMKFILDNVKIDFFQANRPIQKEILKSATFTLYKDSNLKILDVKSIAKLKLVALLQREKSRDLFDFGTILENNILTTEEIIDIVNKVRNIKTIAELYSFIEQKKEPLDDESVYLSEDSDTNLTFNDIKFETLKGLKIDKGVMKSF